MASQMLLQYLRVRGSVRWAKPGAAAATAARTWPIVSDRDYSEPVVSAGVGGRG